jgi:hypothetical protein
MAQISYSSTQQNPSLVTKNTLADNLQYLPTNKLSPSPTDLHLTDQIFGPETTFTTKFISEGKESIIIGLLFIIFSLPQIDELIKKILPIARNSVYFLILIKSLLFMIIFWLIKNFYLSKK